MGKGQRALEEPSLGSLAICCGFRSQEQGGKCSLGISLPPLPWSFSRGLGAAGIPSITSPCPLQLERSWSGLVNLAGPAMPHPAPHVPSLSVGTADVPRMILCWQSSRLPLRVSPTMTHLLLSRVDPPGRFPQRGLARWLSAVEDILDRMPIIFEMGAFSKPGTSRFQRKQFPRYSAILLKHWEALVGGPDLACHLSLNRVLLEHGHTLSCIPCP